MTSLLILASALALFIFWFRHSCSWLLRNQLPQESWREEMEAENAPVRVFRQALRSSLAGTADPQAQLQALEEDFRSLRYLLRRTSPNRILRHSRCEGLLMLDFRFTRFALRLRASLRRPDGQTGFERLYDILDFFTAVVRERLLSAVHSFEALPAFAGGVTPVTVCSYCWHVRQEEKGKWVAARRYQQASEAGQAVLSHGICPDCYEHLVRPTLPHAVIHR